MKGRVLIVEDEGGLREALAEALADAGYEVTQAANGYEALTTLRSSKDLPAVILLDLLMPVINGWQFCKEWRAGRKDGPHVPIVAMSAAASKDPSSPYYIDVDDFLAKPIKLELLLTKIEALTSGHRVG